MSKHKKNVPLKTVPIALKLAESGDAANPTKNAPEKIQILRTGDFNHPYYGTFMIQTSDLASMKANFDARVRGIDIALDYNHDVFGPAAAWFEEVILDNNGTELWVKPRWTPEGAESVVNGEYRYLSADFMFEYTDDETKKIYGPTLMGAGLTNRPFVKDMQPAAQLKEGKGSTMPTIEELQAKLAEMEKTSKEQETKISELTAQLSEKEKAVKLSEAQAEELKKNSSFDKMLSEGKVCEAQREPFLKGDMAKFAELQIAVKLTPAGNGGVPPVVETANGSGDAQVKVLALAKALVLSEKIELKAAISKVLGSNAELAKAYRG